MGSGPPTVRPLDRHQISHTPHLQLVSAHPAHTRRCPTVHPTCPRHLVTSKPSSPLSLGLSVPTCHPLCSEQFPAVSPTPPPLHSACCRLSGASCCVRPSGGPQASSSPPSASAHCPRGLAAHTGISPHAPPPDAQQPQTWPRGPASLTRPGEGGRTLSRAATEAAGRRPPQAESHTQAHPERNGTRMAWRGGWPGRSQDVTMTA
ncbi:hypothetical protein P7K49_036576 [Saguinus oedipus]|uniref:Uncharacterized protein n=1 Tax=Saguinus oedipus TaxID=9490 RepID=A0ABQ9TKI7_SAGOE|nr:hypothetical protein P7K49_036576 [Saguinus oedipus]